MVLASKKKYSKRKILSTQGLYIMCGIRNNQDCFEFLLCLQRYQHEWFALLLWVSDSSVKSRSWLSDFETSLQLIYKECGILAHFPGTLGRLWNIVENSILIVITSWSKPTYSQFLLSTFTNSLLQSSRCISVFHPTFLLLSQLSYFMPIIQCQFITQIS